MTLNKILFFIVIFFNFTTHAEYIVFKNNGNEVLPIEEKDYFDIYTTLQTYQWPMVIGKTDKINKLELEDLSAQTEMAEEKFLRKKIKELSPEYDIVFLPTVIYETFIISLKEEKQGLPFCSMDDIFYISRTFSYCYLSSLDDEIANIVKNSSGLIEDVYDYYNQSNFKKFAYKIHFIANNAFIEFLRLNTDSLASSNFQEKIDQFATNILQLTIKSKSQPWHLSYLYSEEMQKKLIDLEYEARNKNAGLLYRGGRARQVYVIGAKTTEIPIEGSFLATKELIKPVSPTFKKLQEEYEKKTASTKMRDWNLPLNSVSYGSSLFSGFFCDSKYSPRVKSKKDFIGACACDYLSDPSLIGYAVFIDKRKYLSRKLDFLFIPSLNTINNLLASGEFFHPRTKAFQTMKYYSENQGEVDVPGIEFKQTINGIEEGLIDNTETLSPIGDPLEAAQEISEFIQKNARILKLPKDEGDIYFKTEQAKKFIDAQKDLTDMLKAMLTIRKHVRSKKDPYTDVADPIGVKPKTQKPVQSQVMYQTQIKEKALISGSNHLDPEKAIRQFLIEMKSAAAENSKIPLKSNSTFRIMTYNVHYWRNPADYKSTILDSLEIIKKLNPDVLILQEVTPLPGLGRGKDFDGSLAMQLLKEKAQLPYFSYCNTLGDDIWLGNVIASKIPFKSEETYFTNQQGQDEEEKRCYMSAQAKLPNKKEIYMYGTHLEVSSNEIREKQINEIEEKVMNNLKNKNVLIAGDFNSARNSEVIRSLRKNGFVDCFSYLGWKHPKFTNWSGKEIDFIFLSPDWNLPLAGCYVYYDAASDHFPIIMDIKL